MRKFYLVISILLFTISYAKSQSTGDFRTNSASGTWSTLADWDRFNGSIWVSPAPNSPTSTDGVVTIQAGHTMNMDVNTTVDQVVVENTGDLVIDIGVTMTIADGSGVDLSLDGTLTQDDDGFGDGSVLDVNGHIQVTTNGTTSRNGFLSPIRFFSGSTYEHARNGGSIPVNGITWNSGSTMLVTGVTNSAPTFLNQNYNNFHWDCSGQSVTIQLSWSTRTITGDIQILDTNNRSLLFNNTGTANINVSGNFDVSGNSRFFLSGSGSTSVTCTNFDMNSSAASSSFFTTSGSGTLNILGNTSFTSGTITHASLGGTATMNFNGGSTQTYTGGGTFASGTIMDLNATNTTTLQLGSSSLETDGSVIITSGSTLDTGTGFVGDGASGGSITVNLGGRVAVGSADGIDNGTLIGGIRMSTRTYQDGSTLAYNGSVQQNVGDGFPSVEIVNLEIDNSSGVVNNNVGTTSVLGDLILTSGALIIGSNTLDIEDDVVANGGTLRGSDESVLIFSGSGTVSGTPGTIDLESGFQTLLDFTISRNEDVPLGTDLTMEGTLTFSGAGNLILDDGITLSTFGTGGDIDQSGASQGAISSPSSNSPLANLDLAGTGALTDLPICSSCGGQAFETVTFGRSGGGTYTWADAATVTTIALETGTLTHSSGLTIADGGEFQRGSGGTLAANAPNAAGTYDVNYTGGTLTSGLELPTAASNELANLTSAANVTLDKAILITGNFTITSGTVNASTNDVEMAGSTWDVTGGSFTMNSANTLTFSGTSVVINASSPISFGNVAISGGSTVDFPNDDVSISGVISGAGTIVPNNGTVIFDGTGTQNINTSNGSFNNVTFATSSSTKSLQGTLNASGVLTINSGVTLDVDANQTINISGSWVNNGSFLAQTGTVNFNGGNQTISSNGDAFFNLTLSSSGGGVTKDLGDAIDIDGQLTIGTNVTFETGGGSEDINIAGNWVNNGTFSGGTGLVVFDGTSAISGSSTTNFENVDITGSLTAPSGNMIVSGSWDASGGTFDPNGGLVTFDGATETIQDGGNSFFDLTIDGSNTKSIFADLDIDNDLILSGGTFAAGSNSITIGGDWTTSGGTFTTSGNVTFDGVTDQTITGTSNFSGLTISNTGQAVILAGDVDIDGLLDINSTLTGGSNDVSLAGNWDATGGGFSFSTGEVTLDGSSQTVTSNGGAFGDLTVAGTATKLLLDALDVNGDLMVTSTLDNNGEASSVSGNIDASSGTFNHDNTLTLDGASAQNFDIGSNTLTNLTINGAGGVILTGSSTDINGNLLLTTGSSLSMGANDIDFAGSSFDNDGTFNGNTGIFSFDGSGTQDVLGDGIITLNDVIVGASSSVEVETAVSSTGVTGTVTLTNGGDFDADGSTNSGLFSLISTADDPTVDGNIAEIGGSSTFQGDVTVQRFTSDEDGSGITTGVWRYISSPVSGLTVGDWQNSFPITGSFTNSNNGDPCCPVGAGASLYLYDESNTGTGIDDGWEAYPTTDDSAPIETGRGYSAFLRDDTAPITISHTGPINSGNWDFTNASMGDLTYTSTGTPSVDGWNLIGNPYPSAIDWEDLHPGSTNISNTIYIRNNPGGNFATYQIGGASTNGGEREIAIGQAFWVQASGAPSLDLDETMKTNASHSFFKDPSPDNTLKVKLSDGVLSDEIIIRFDENSTADIDAFDAYKFDNDIFNLASIAMDNSNLVINTLGSLSCDAQVGLNIYNIDEGNYSLDFSEFESFIDPVNVTLIDNYSGVEYDVDENPIVPFEVTSDSESHGNSRFSISFGSQSIIQDLLVSSPSGECNTAVFDLTVADSQDGIEYQAFIDGNAASDISIGDGTEITLSVTAPEDEEFEVEIFATKEGCASLPLNTSLSLSKIAEVTSAEDLTICSGEAATLTAEGAPEAGFYNWYLNIEDVDPIVDETSNTLVVDELDEDRSYFVSITNSNGCESDRVEVVVIVQPVLEITSTQSGQVCPGGTALLIATGGNENSSYRWYEGESETPIEGETAESLDIEEVFVNQEYYVSVVNDLGCESEKVLVRAEVIPTKQVESILGGATCIGGSLNLVATGASPTESYQWYDAEGAPIDGEIGSELQLSDLQETRSYGVAVVNSLGCAGEIIEVVAEVNEAPLDLEVAEVVSCNPGMITIVAEGGPENGIYTWYDSDGVTVEGVDGSELSVEISESTTYTVQVINDEGCVSPVVEGIVSLVALSTPDINLDEDYMSTSATGDSYQWYLDGVAIDGAVGPILQHSYEGGVYTIEVFSDGCSIISEPAVVTSVSDELANNEVTVFPNPASRFINVTRGNINGKNVSLYIIDMKGQIVKSNVIDVFNGSIDSDVDIQDLDNGTYFVRIVDENQLLSSRFIKY